MAEREREQQIATQIDQFGVMYPFDLDAFQAEAIGHFLRDDSVLVAAPTGSGKTVVAEFGIFHALRGAGRVFYTTPIKALSNQKFRDLRTIYGDDVGLLTGDVTENRDARIIVMTTEILRNMLLQTPWDVDDVNCVIFDEIHYLADQERGTTWEEAIILCPEHVQLICLSATVSNSGEIADWISRTHRPIKLVTHYQRAVPLALEYFIDGKLQTVVNHRGEVVKDFPKTGGEARRQGGRGMRDRRRDRGRPEIDEPQPREIIEALAEQDRLPAIYFLFSRNDCQQFAERLAMMSAPLVSAEQTERIEAIITAHLGQLREEDFALEQVKAILSLTRSGIGFHHAGLLPILKQLVEVLFARGLMQVVFATDTLALGVNMPARTVVIGRMSKWDGRQRRMLIPNEFQQMAGRAGRRGMDQFGHVVVPYSPWVPFREMREIATGPLLPVRSAFAIRYNTVLNLWDPPEGERVRTLLQRSLAQFQTSQRIRQIEQDIVEIGGDIAAIPQGCLIGYEDGENLLEDYRSVVAALTSAQGRERQTREDRDRALIHASDSTPWTEPGRVGLRKLFRTTPAGIIVHGREHGWGVYLGRGGLGGVGLFLFGETIRLLTEYREIDYLPDDVQVTLPADLIEPPDGVVEPLELVGADTLADVHRQMAALDLPDLAVQLAEHQARERQRLDAQLADLADDEALVATEISALVESRNAHPCHACDRRKEHRDNLAQIDRLHQERNALEEISTREVDAEEVRIRNLIRGIGDVLLRFGYLRRGYPTEKADMLADIFDNDGLILCELVDRGWLDRLTPEDLAEVFSWFCFDRDFRYTNHYTLPKELVALRRRLEELEREILGEERDHNLFISEGHNQGFYGAARAWCTGATMVSISETIELSEGDLVLTFNKTIDLMRQAREMLTGIMSDHPMRASLRVAEGMLRRGIVAQSLSLGFAPVEVPAGSVPVEPDAPNPELSEIAAETVAGGLIDRTRAIPVVRALADLEAIAQAPQPGNSSESTKPAKRRTSRKRTQPEDRPAKAPSLTAALDELPPEDPKPKRAARKKA